MNWAAFQSHGEALTGAFEAFCNQLFDLYCKREYSGRIISFAIVNGSGGDGGVEAYAKLDDGSFVGIQSKWFLNSIEAREISQIRNSVRTAMTVRPTLQRYIVCIPRDLASSTARTTNSEDARWASFIKEMLAVYPNLEIILWHESKLREELQLDVTGGIRRYWFEQEELSIESMKFQFSKAKAGWLQPKYIPSLHGQGRIHDEMKNILPDRSRHDEWIRLLRRNLESVQFIRKEIAHAIAFFQQKELTVELTVIDQYLSQVEPNIVQLVESCQYGTEPKEFSMSKRPNPSPTLELLNKIPIRSLTSINKSDITKAITQFAELEVEEHMLQIKNLISRKMYAFLGDPGTGKTHGVANAIEEHVELGNNPGFIIQAKSYTASSTWRSILADSVGLSASWTEEEIWRALEASAYRCDVRNARGTNENHEFVPTKILMCIDGLDESIPWDHWHEKIRELQIITERFPRIRVVVASRPYVFSSATLHGLTPIHLSAEGDLRVGDLFERYLKAYHIRFEEAEYFAWLRWSLKTPFALRLFCDQYCDQTLHKQDGVSTTISHLLAGKIKQVDEEIGRSLGALWNTKDQLVLRALLSIVNHVLEHSSIERSLLSSLILDSVPNGAINASAALHMIDFLTKYGLLYEIAEQTNPLIPTTVRYEVATQPLMDYLLAVKLVEGFNQNGKVSIPEIFFKRVGAQQMAAIMLLQDHNTLVTQQIGWNRSNLFNIQLFALANVSADKTVPYVEKTKEMLVKSMPLSRRIVNELIGRVARVPNHPLGPNLLHGVLDAFKTPAERDLFWSLPEYVPGQGYYSWEGHGECICSIEEYELFPDDLHWGLPLLYAWNLTNTDNTIRNNARKKLTRWGMQNPSEFTELLKLTFNTNDPQMKEDLACCAYGVASRLTHERIALKALTEWALNAIFHKDRIQSNMNAVVRFAGRAIAERAMVYGAITEEEIQMARPPYSPATELMMLNSEAASAGRDGFEPINGDLSWYVIKKGYEDFFQIDDEKESGHPHTQIERAPTSLLVKLADHIQDISVKQEIEKELLQRDEKSKQYEQFQRMLHKDYELFNVSHEYDVNENEVQEAEDDIDCLLNDVLNNLENSRQTEETMEVSAERDRYSREAREFLKRHAINAGLSKLTPHQFAIASASAYLNRMGWNREQFIGKPNGGKSGEVLGVDISIIRAYQQATHGSRSTVMPFSEKYVWCAVHEMLGYLADRLPHYSYGDDGKEKVWVSDYSILLNVPNPVQELSSQSPDEVRGRTGWFIPDDLSPSLSECDDDQPETITNWIRNAPIPDFKRWIYSTEDEMTAVSGDLTGSWVCLCNQTTLTEPNTLSDSILWMKSCIIKETDFPLFIQDLHEKSSQLIDNLSDPIDQLHSSPRTDTYMNPSALSWMHWIEDLYSSFRVFSVNEQDLKEYEVWKCVSEVTHSSVEEREFTFTLPSKIIRDMVQVADGDGWRYWDQNMNVLSFYSIAGSEYRNHQELLFASKNTLDNALAQHKYRMIWVIRMLREPSPKVREKHGDFFIEHDRVWVAYEHQGTFHLSLIKEIVDGRP